MLKSGLFAGLARGGNVQWQRFFGSREKPFGKTEQRVNRRFTQDLRVYFHSISSENGEKKDTRCADPEHEFRPKMGISRAKVEKI